VDDVAGRVPVGEMLAVVGAVGGADPELHRAAGADGGPAHGEEDARRRRDDGGDDQPGAQRQPVIALSASAVRQLRAVTGEPAALSIAEGVSFERPAPSG